MLQFVLGIGIAYFFLKEGSRTTSDQEKPGEPEEPETTPEPEPTPEPMDFTRFASWSGEYSAGENVVWLYQAGIRYDDGSEEMDSTSYVVIGNSDHTAFLRSNSNRGTIDIPKELTGGSTDQKNVQVFSSIEQASARADELADDTPRDPTDPVQPQPEPQEPPSNPRPGFPQQPDYGLGGGGGSLFSNGGI